METANVLKQHSCTSVTVTREQSGNMHRAADENLPYLCLHSHSFSISQLTNTQYIFLKPKLQSLYILKPRLHFKHTAYIESRRLGCFH